MSTLSQFIDEQKTELKKQIDFLTEQIQAVNDRLLELRVRKDARQAELQEMKDAEAAITAAKK